MRVAIIGANGQLGTDLVGVFGGHLVIPWTREDFDVCDHQRALKAIVAASPDVVINTAALHRTDLCEHNPPLAFAVNAIAVRNLARSCRTHRATLVQISSDYVFGGEKAAPYTEDDCPAPINVYGVSKLAGEQFVAAICDDYYIFRVAGLFGVAGSRGKGGNFVDGILQKAKTGEVVRVVDDVVMSPTYTADAAFRILRFVETKAPAGIYHVTNSGSCSWYELAETVFELCRMDSRLEPWTAKEGSPEVRRPRNSSLQSCRLQLLDMEPMRPWREALRDYLRAKGHLRAAD